MLFWFAALLWTSIVAVISYNAGVSAGRVIGVAIGREDARRAEMASRQ